MAEKVAPSFTIQNKWFKWFLRFLQYDQKTNEVSHKKVKLVSKITQTYAIKYLGGVYMCSLLLCSNPLV